MATKRRKRAPPATAEFDFSDLSSYLDETEVSIGYEESLNDLRGFLSTGCFVLDAEIGQGCFLGGYPIGRFTEIYGVPGVGKTSMATAAMVSAQKGRGCLLKWMENRDELGHIQFIPEMAADELKPGLAILADSEFKWPLDRAQKMGLNVEQLVRVRPKIAKKTAKKDAKIAETLTVEEVLSSLESTLRRVKSIDYFRRPDVPVLFVWDSLAASPISAEMEGDGLQEGIASKARKVRAAMRRMTGLLAALNVTVVIVNQTYAKIGPRPGKEASGGDGLKFHSSHRIEIWRAGTIASSMKPVGITARMKATKSVICPPTHDTAVPLMFDRGVDDDRALLDFFLTGRGKDTLITAHGAWFKVVPEEGEDPVSFQYNSWSGVLETHSGLRKKLQDEVMRILRGD
jgi:recombination protein RecA